MMDFETDLGLVIKENEKDAPKHYVEREWITNQPTDTDYDTSMVKYAGTDIERYPDNYRPEYDKIAYYMMQDEDSTFVRVCIALKISFPTFQKWLKRHPSFKDAVDTGKLISEDKFRKKITDVMYKPAAGVNTGLIKMMASSVHNINDTPQIVINNNQSQDTKVLSEKETSLLYAEAIERVSTELDGFDNNFENM